MSEFESMSSDQQEFEQSLQQLRPVEPEIDVADLMFRAGQDSARRESQRQLRRWQLSTLVTSVCALLAVSILWPGTTAVSRPESSMADHTHEDVPVREQKQNDGEQETVPEMILETFNTRPGVAHDNFDIDPQPLPLFDWWDRQSTVSVTSEESYIGLRNRVLRDGIDALPESKIGGGSNSAEPLTASPLRARDALNRELWNQI